MWPGLSPGNIEFIYMYIPTCKWNDKKTPVACGEESECLILLGFLGKFHPILGLLQSAVSKHCSRARMCLKQIWWQCFTFYLPWITCVLGKTRFQQNACSKNGSWKESKIECLWKRCLSLLLQCQSGQKWGETSSTSSTTCSLNINRCPLHRLKENLVENICNSFFFKPYSLTRKDNTCHCHSIPISHWCCYWSLALASWASMPNLLHTSYCQKQSLQMKPKGCGSPFLLIKAELGKRHEAGVYSMCCQWQAIKQLNASLCMESVLSPIAYFSVWVGLEYSLYIFTNVQCKKTKTTIRINKVNSLSLHLHCLTLLFVASEKGWTRLTYLSRHYMNCPWERGGWMSPEMRVSAIYLPHCL